MGPRHEGNLGRSQITVQVMLLMLRYTDYEYLDQVFVRRLAALFSRVSPGRSGFSNGSCPAPRRATILAIAAERPASVLKCWSRYAMENRYVLPSASKLRRAPGCLR